MVDHRHHLVREVFEFCLLFHRFARVAQQLVAHPAQQRLHHRTFILKIQIKGALGHLAEKLGAKVDRVKFQGLTGQAEWQGHKLILLKPTTYMNLSGQAVQAAARFYKIPPERTLVMFDDISLDPGRLRVRKNGSAGGHNGVKSIISCIGSQEFPRVKIGVGAKPHPDYDLADWVLSTFPLDQRDAMDDTYKRAAEAALLIITQGPEAAANRYNGK